MKGFKLVQKMECIEESECRRRWKRYTLKNQTLGAGIRSSTYPLMRAWDKQLQKNVVIEFMPRGCVLNMYPEPVESPQLLRLIQLQHPQLLGVQDVFYCDRMKCVCLVYDLCSRAEPLTNRISSMNLKDIQRVFKQIANALAFLYRQGIVVGWFNMEDVFITPDPTTATLNAEIRYIKLGYRKDMFHMYIHPEYYFPKLINKTQYSTQDCQAYHLSWQMGILLLEMLRGHQFPTNCTQQEYVHNVDQICNYWDSPDISISMHLPKEVTEILTGLTAVGLEERWHVEKMFDFLWVDSILSKPGSKPGLEREDEFVSLVSSELLECQGDGDEDEVDSDDGGSKEAELKEVVEEYVQYYEEAKALQEKNQGRRKQRARKLSLSECYYQIMASKHLGGELQNYLCQESVALTDSILSEDLTDYSGGATSEFGDVQNVAQERPFLRTNSMPSVHLQDVIQSLANKWGRCLRRNTHSFKLT